MQDQDLALKARMYTPQVKICGLTRVEEALACVELGADAIGCVFYSRSPRNVTEEKARNIRMAFPPERCSLVGVFVNEPFSSIMGKVETCGLDAVQLHGQESPQLVEELARRGVPVIKGLFVNAEPFLDSAPFYKAHAYLAECAGGRLPGGNALAWNWDAAVKLSQKYPLVLAGGLNPENVGDAIRAASPDAVDVSSGVEAEPGRKDLDKVERFLEAVSRESYSQPIRRIFTMRRIFK